MKIVKSALLVLLLVLLGIAGYVWYKFSTEKSGSLEGDKAEKIKIGKHGVAFNASLDSMVAGYFLMKDAFVEADTAAIKAKASKLIVLVDSIHLDDLKKDTAVVIQTAAPLLDNVKSNTQSILSKNDIGKMRSDFKQVSDQLYSFLLSINYEGKKIYWQNCPMAFDDAGANWLSNTREIINPYFGKKDVKYGNGMLTCGDTQDTVMAK